MNLDAVVDELHQIVAEKTPKGTSPQLILERLRASFPPLHPREVSNEEAKAILLKRGESSRNRLEKAGGGALAAEEVADLIGYSRQGVDHLRKTNRLVAWRRGNGKWHYPVWQFEDGHIRPGIQECLEHLSENPWGRMLFFLNPREITRRKTAARLALEGTDRRCGACRAPASNPWGLRRFG
jgi:hypothetical protein